MFIATSALSGSPLASISVSSTVGHAPRILQGISIIRATDVFQELLKDIAKHKRLALTGWVLAGSEGARLGR